jgi:hypothetical protein
MLVRHQFSLIASHKVLMTVLGGMSESERQHVQARVRAAMDAQVVNDGRHQGGRAPYGYVTVNAGPHPNPRKAAEGGCLWVLEIDEPSAEVVRRIFWAYVDGNGDRAIATILNEEGVPCPSARWPEQNRHRQADGWRGSTVRAIIDNPRYTGYAVFGWWARREMLLNPDDVAAGHVIRFRWVAPNRIVRSREPAPPAIISVELFTAAQLFRRAKNAGGLATARKAERGKGATHVRPARHGPVRGVPSSDGGGDGAEERLLPLCVADDGARFDGVGRSSGDGQPAGGRARLGGERVGRRTVLPENVDRTVAELVGAQAPGRSTAVWKR